MKKVQRAGPQFYNGSEMVGFARDDQHYRVHSDWLSSVRSVTDAAGNTVFSASYGPWGEQTVTDNVPNGIAMRWIGGRGVRLDEGAGLYYMRNRFYDAMTAIFISRDRVRSRNRYRYTSGNPIVSADPSGLVVTWSNTWTDNPQHTHMNPGNTYVADYISVQDQLTTLLGSADSTTKTVFLPRLLNLLTTMTLTYGSPSRGVLGEYRPDLGKIYLYLPCGSATSMGLGNTHSLTVLAAVLLHEYLHHAYKVHESFVPAAVYEDDMTDLVHHTKLGNRQEAWIQLQEARAFASMPSIGTPTHGEGNEASLLKGLAIYDHVWNPDGRLDSDPAYLDKVAEYLIRRGAIDAG